MIAGNKGHLRWIEIRGALSGDHVAIQIVNEAQSVILQREPAHASICKEAGAVNIHSVSNPRSQAIQIVKLKL